MKILGIVCSHDGTLTYVENGIHKFSIGEERINRIKSYIGFPFQSLRYAIENGLIDVRNVDAVSIPLNYYPWRSAEIFSYILTEEKRYYDIQNEKKPSDYYSSDDSWKRIKTDKECQTYFKEKLATLLGQYGIDVPIHFYDHHLSHAASAYYSSGIIDKPVLCFTCDGEGDNLSASVNVCRDGMINVVSRTHKAHSAGYLYSAVTKRCGFKVSRHEGKITGLAAYGDPSVAYNILSNRVQVKQGKLNIEKIKGFSLHERVVNKLLRIIGIHRKIGAYEVIDHCKHVSDKDLAAAIQLLLEERLSEIVTFWVGKTGIKDVVLAGGVFANVKINQRISMLPSVDSLYVYPDMGDGGTAYGAAILAEHEFSGTFDKNMILNDAYLGPKFSDDEIYQELIRNKHIKFYKSDDIASETANFIAKKKIVGWFQGRMEYGPRALGNRSILASPEDGAINKWLNARMRRTEFMPFAPSCLYEYADEVFEIEKKSLKRAAEFMTITFHMKDAWVKRAPAVAHIDKTARPQLVKKSVNPLYHKLLTRYFELTGLPLIVNTSFNVHEEPIVCNPSEAIRALTDSVIDVLAVGSFIAILDKA